MKTGFHCFGLCASLLLTPFSTLVHSFPTAENFGKLISKSDTTLGEVLEHVENLKQKRLLFDPLTTPISVTGANAFQPPNFANGDQRGPCPGLNALANHGYLSRDGVVGVLDVITVVNSVLGMGLDLTAFLAVISVVSVGNPVSLTPSFSIGGPSAKVLGGVSLGLLPVPLGISGTHGLIESDGSSTRDDLYITGNVGDPVTMNMTKFLEVYNAIPVNGAMTMDNLAARAAKRFDESVANNPWFYYGPYSGMLARHGGYLFAGRLLSNHSKEYPMGGNITRDVFASFWGVSKDSTGTLVYNKGWERIPPNWYRIAADYGFANVVADLVIWFAQYPQLASIGGNVGAVNTFAGLDITNVTGGVLNAKSLLQSNNLVCFSLQVVRLAFPSQFASVFATLNTLLGGINPVTGPIADLSCPVFTELQMGGTDLLTYLKNTYPGAKKAGTAL